jgi:polyisoprenoid-binding protein YceI
MKVAIILLSLISAPTFAKCFKLKKNSAKIEWTSYKTPAKAGVSGTFKKVNFTKIAEGPTIKDVIKSASFEVNTSSVFSKDPGRDKKIANFFFSTMAGGHKIVGVVKKVKKKSILVDFTLNGVTKTVPLKYEIDDNELEAEGVIDVFDFSMHKQLAALNKACFAKHEGKTWSDVAIEIEADFTSCK